ESEIFGAVAEKHLDCDEIHKIASVAEQSIGCEQCSSGCKKNCCSGLSLTNSLNQDVNHAVDQPALLDEGKRTGDEQGGDAVSARPKGLRDFFNVVAVKLSRIHAAPDRSAKAVERLFAGLRLFIVRNLFGLHKRNYVVVWIVDTELHV